MSLEQGIASWFAYVPQWIYAFFLWFAQRIYVGDYYAMLSVVSVGVASCILAGFFLRGRRRILTRISELSRKALDKQVRDFEDEVAERVNGILEKAKETLETKKEDLFRIGEDRKAEVMRAGEDALFVIAKRIEEIRQLGKTEAKPEDQGAPKSKALVLVEAKDWVLAKLPIRPRAITRRLRLIISVAVFVVVEAASFGYFFPSGAPMALPFIYFSAMVGIFTVAASHMMKEDALSQTAMARIDRLENLFSEVKNRQAANSPKGVRKEMFQPRRIPNTEEIVAKEMK